MLPNYILYSDETDQIYYTTIIYERWLFNINKILKYLKKS